MQADGILQTRSKHGKLPFHLAPLDFDISPSKLRLLSSEQLALVQFHPDATDTVKTKAEILFLQRREQDQHLLEDNDYAQATEEAEPPAADERTVALATPLDVKQSSKSPYPATNAAAAEDPALHQANGGSNGEAAQEVEATGPDAEEKRQGSSRVHDGDAKTAELEDGELSDGARDENSEANAGAVKEEDRDDDLVLLVGPSLEPSRQLSTGVGQNRRTSVPLSVNVGTTYSGRQRDYGGRSGQSQERSEEPRASTSTLLSERKRRSRRSTRHESRRAEHDERLPEKVSRSKRARSPERQKRNSTSRQRTKRSRSRIETDKHSNNKKRRRQRSYFSSSGSSSSSNSSFRYSSESYSSSCSESGSDTSSRSRSSSAESRHRHRQSRRPLVAHHPVLYSTAPVPIQLHAPTILPTPPEDDLSRQQLSHMYRNMPSNPNELFVHSSTMYTASPPRPAQNNFSFPGQDRVPPMPPPQAMQMRGAAGGNIHPARARAMSSGADFNAHAASSFLNSSSGYDDHQRGPPRGNVPPRRPQGNGWPEPRAPAPRRDLGWPDDRPNRPRQSRPPARGDSWSAPKSGGGARNDAWGGGDTSKSTSSGWGDSGSKADAWGDSAGSTNVWGDKSPTYAASAGAQKPASASTNPWGSPEPSTTSAAKKPASAWGDDDNNAGQAKSLWD
ncbi:hypothetical protein P389DRAFT_164871 [Cystobasidium minutum MCA 4210]|uniref:uncharacterized protein n=1 Tax=Cystobasidium minutum MCA 4210 TaxID=1397322 RepID=UPI0034CD27C7|eukprot:jgi/Rhomi1/164871/fgenesh1_kg.1_\